MFSTSKFKKGNKNFFFLYFSPGNLLTIFYQLTKFEAPSCNIFLDFFITGFQCSNLQREITQKNIFFFNFHQVIYSSSSTGFALGFIFLSPPFSPIRFFLCHFLKLRARFLAIFRPKRARFWGIFCKKKSSVFNPLNSGGVFYTH